MYCKAPLKVRHYEALNFIRTYATQCAACIIPVCLNGRTKVFLQYRCQTFVLFLHQRR